MLAQRRAAAVAVPVTSLQAELLRSRRLAGGALPAATPVAAPFVVQGAAAVGDAAGGDDPIEDWDD